MIELGSRRKYTYGYDAYGGLQHVVLPNGGKHVFGLEQTPGKYITYNLLFFLKKLFKYLLYVNIYNFLKKYLIQNIKSYSYIFFD